MDVDKLARADVARSEENALRDPNGTASTFEALREWLRSADSELEVAYHSALHVGTPSPRNLTHSVLLRVTHDPSIADPSLAFIIDSVDVYTHAELGRQLGSSLIGPQLAETIRTRPGAEKRENVPTRAIFATRSKKDIE
jgi:hypothetical protein